MVKNRLRDVPLFAGLGKRELEMLSRVADEVDVPAGKVLATEGDLGKEFFVIESGTAEVTRGDERVAELGPGDFFGEIALIEEQRRTATVTATSATTVIVLTRSSFRSLETTLPSVYAKVRDEIAKRRRQAA